MQSDPDKSWEDIVEEHISAAMERGEFEGLRGTGKPLKLEQDRLVPREHRLAYRIMRDNDVQPDWIMLKKQVEDQIKQARQHLFAASVRFAKIMAEHDGQPGIESIKQRLAARDLRDEAKAVFRERIQRINRLIKELNLKVPAAHLSEDAIDADQEIQKFFSS